MNFYVIGDDMIRVVFEEEETTHQFFNQTISKVRNICHAKKETDTEYILTLKDKNTTEPPTVQLGRVLDRVRECYMCDVLPESDQAKDRSKCPEFKFTPHLDSIKEGEVLKKDSEKIKK